VPATAVTFHGGPVLTQMQAQAVYLGSSWSNDSGLPVQRSQFDGFLKSAVTGGYLDMLGAAGYTSSSGTPIGHGSVAGGVVDPVSLAATNLKSNSTYASTVLTDAQIQGYLKSLITAKSVQAPGSGSLYVVYVQPNVIVDQRSTGLSLNDGSNSTSAFLGYHGSFVSGASTIRYVVLPFQGSNGFANNAGHASNAQEAFLSVFDSTTMVASHELAEAATDPDFTGWYETVSQLRESTEIGDLDVASTVYLGGYAVQRESAPAGTPFNFMAMTPAGATAGHAVGFSVQSGALYVYSDAAGSVKVSNPSSESGVAVSSISGQGIDAFGQPMIDVIFADGNAWEYHDFPAGNSFAAAYPSLFPFTFMTSNAKQAKAGQAASYVLLTNGNLGEYVDANFSIYRGAYGFGINPTPHGGNVIASNVLSIDAGTDRYGVNSVDYVTSVSGQSQLNEWRDETVTSAVLAANVGSYGAGRQGVHVYVDAGSGGVYLFSEATGTASALPTNTAASGQAVTSVVIGTSSSGGYLVAAVYGDGSAYQYDGATWSSLGTGVAAVSEPVNGLVRVLLTTGEAYELSGAGGAAFWDSPASNNNTGVA
jgi:hypothetical protein